MSGPRLMGRQAAGHSFLRGYFRFGTSGTLCAFTPKASDRTAFLSFAQAEKVQKPLWAITPETFDELKAAQTLFLPGPGLDEFARKRSLFGSSTFSLCGITHTTLSARAMDAITSLLLSPVEPWDALICTSRSVRDTIKTVLEAEADYLKYRLGATRFTLPKLPVIPLGIMTEDFNTSPDKRVNARKFLKIEPDEIVILFVGRLSFHAKAHPAAMYQVLQAAGKSKKLVLIECGWFANQSIELAFDEAASKLAPNIRRITLDGRRADVKSVVWQAADIFMSLTDNLQETFGITPIEAMASGLPVIVTDWDGYRDTVRHGIDGFRIPTLMPQSGTAPNCALPYALDLINYDQYCGQTAHFVAVDIDAARLSLNALLENPDLRKTMGKQGQERARSMYDWKKIIAIYEHLWRELDEERRASIEVFTQPSPLSAWPARSDPLKSFASYPTDLISQDTEICLVTDDAAEIMQNQIDLSVFTLSQSLIGDVSRINKVVFELDTNEPKSLRKVADDIALPLDQVMPIIMFGLKVGALRTTTAFRKLDDCNAI